MRNIFKLAGIKPKWDYENLRVGDTIIYTVGEGCQAVSEFKWIGKVHKFQFNKNKDWKEVVIEIMKYNLSHGDNRNQEKEYYTYPLVNNDIQNVNGVWILFT